jgi:hypothetical protein
MKVLLKFLFLACLLQISSAKATLLLSCNDLFRSKVSGSQATHIIDHIIQEQLDMVGLKISLHSQSNFFSRWRAQKLIQQLDESLLKNENLRHEWIEKAVRLKMDESLDLFEQVKNPINQDQRRTLNRLVLRSLMHQGLSTLSKDLDPPSLKSILRKIRSHPVFQFLFLWQLPRTRIHLSETQVFKLLQSSEIDLTDPDLKTIMGRENQEMRKRKVNSMAALTVAIVLTTSTAWSVYPEVESSFERGQALAVEKNTRDFVHHVEEMTQIQSEQINLKMAQAELQMLTQKFTEKYNTAPTPSEKMELLNHICKIRYGDILSSESQRICMEF